MEKEGKKVKERDEINKKVFKTCLMSSFSQITLPRNKTELEGNMLPFCPVSSLEKTIFDSKLCGDI